MNKPRILLSYFGSYYNWSINSSNLCADALKKSTYFKDFLTIKKYPINFLQIKDLVYADVKKGYDYIFFIDDSPKNVAAVKNLKKKYPKVTFVIKQA